MSVFFIHVSEKTNNRSLHFLQPAVGGRLLRVGLSTSVDRENLQYVLFTKFCCFFEVVFVALL